MFQIMKYMHIDKYGFAYKPSFESRQRQTKLSGQNSSTAKGPATVVNVSDHLKPK